MDRDGLKGIKRVVVKVGSSSITHPTGKLNFAQVERLVRQLADLHNQDYQVILVTSGAVGAGMGKLGLKHRPKTIPEKQALAAVGQGLLMHMYEKMFAEYGQTVAQILLTKQDMADRHRFLNARTALLSLLNFGVIPIINENDTVAVEEIKFGDNDTLSAMVASLADADLLVILSDINGLYTANPHSDPTAQLISQVDEITPEIEQIAGGAGSGLGTGGMVTKLQAAKIAMNSGVAMVIGHGAEEGILSKIVSGQDEGTLFMPKECPLQCKKRWIAYGSSIQGKLVIDDGAQDVLQKSGKSLLAIGIIDVHGSFDVGNSVGVYNQHGTEIARGIVNYSASELDKIKGVKTTQIASILGYKDYDEVIHRDNLVLWG